MNFHHVLIFLIGLEVLLNVGLFLCGGGWLVIDFSRSVDENSSPFMGSKLAESNVVFELMRDRSWLV